MMTAGSGSTRGTRVLPGPLKPWWTGYRLATDCTWSASLYLPKKSTVRLQPSDCTCTHQCYQKTQAGAGSVSPWLVVVGIAAEVASVT